MSQVAQLWSLVKARRSGILEQIDEPTDLLPRLVARVAVDALFVRYPGGSVNREEWGRLADGRGWIALWYAGSELAVLDDTPACWELPLETQTGAQAAM